MGFLFGICGYVMSTKGEKAPPHGILILPPHGKLLPFCKLYGTHLKYV